ncbi:cellulose synthase subunit BcsC-related outer membrane protein [Desulfacinum infernum]|nr:cellulose synthase subunit BcsC-related outer membrane protein [Desulfacinum infernum]
MKRILLMVVFLLAMFGPGGSTAGAPPSDGGNRPAPAAQAEREASDVRARASLEIAWWHYREERFQRALALFDQVMRGTGPVSLRQEAQWGKALCLDRLKRKDEAAALMEDLHRQGVRTRELERWLSDYRRGRAIVRRSFHEERIRNEAAAAAAAADPDALSRFARRNEKALRRCIAPEAFFEAARALRRKGRSAEARSLQERLLECTAERYDLRLGIYAELMDLTTPEEMLARLGEEKDRTGVPASYRKGLDALETEALRRRLAALSEKDPETEAVARRILERNPDDPDALLKLGWHRYHAGRFSEAEALFSRLRSARPERPEAALGLAHALISQKRFGEALDALQALEPPYPEGYRSALLRLHLEEGAHWRKERDLPKAEAAYRRAVELNPDDGAPLRSLGWVLLEQGRAREAAEVFDRALALEPDAEGSQGLLLSLEKAGRFTEAHRKAETLARAEDPSLRRAAADHFRRSGKALLAASTAPEETNDAGPWSTVQASYESRSGDDGTSRLKTVRLPWRLYLPAGAASLWVLEVEGIRPDTGDPGSDPFVGSAGLPGSGSYDESRWISSRWVASPSVAWAREGAWDVRARVGLTPLGGPVDPVPTFSLELSNPRWRLEVHQQSVEDSLLSWIGQRDPYSDDTWGRVLRTGGSAGCSLSWANGTWASLRIGADHYWGEGVWRNFSLSGDAAFGRSFPWKAGTVSAGAFLSAAHYDRNTDFYTLGHGGYFSPSVFVMAGPTLRFQTDPGRTWWLDAEASAGYLYYETESSPVHPRRDRPERYAGDRFSGLGYSGSLRAVKLLTPHWAVGVHLDADKSSGYTRWSAGAGLIWFPAARSTLGRTTPRYDAFFRPQGR